MADIAEDDWTDLPREAAPKRRRRYFELPSSYTVQRFMMISVVGCALFGGVLGDIWLWRLLYG